MEEKTREGRISRVGKEVVGCVQSVVGKKKFLFQLVDGQKIYMSYCLLVYVCLKEEVGQDVDEPISDIPQKEQCEILIIDGDPVGEEGSIFERGVYFFKLIRGQQICHNNRCWKR